ncbi:MAG: MBL fold metallo-hydrolase [Acidimicrobiales bacterium]
MAQNPIPLASGVWRLPTLGSSAVNSFAFLDDDGTVTLVDTGLKGAPKRLIASLSAIGKQPVDVSRIVLTHAHPDHVGGCRTMRARTSAEVQIHDADAPFLREGKRPPADPLRPLARVFAFTGSSQPSCSVDETFSDGDIIPVGGGLQVLHTPGHSPGHCSFLHPRSGVLITGDALFNLRHRIRYSFALFCSNYAMSIDTAERLAEPDYEIAAFTHGPEIRDGAREVVRSFLRHRKP